MATNKQASGKTPAKRETLKETAVKPTTAPAPSSTVGVDPRDGDAAAAAALNAAAPTPNQNTLESANEAPGAGSSTGPGPLVDADKPRKRVKLKNGEEVAVMPTTRAFTLTDDDGTQTHYPVGTEKMPADHVDHWYSVAHGVERA